MPYFFNTNGLSVNVAELIIWSLTVERGIHIHANDEEILHVLVKIAEYTCSVEKIKKWLREKVCPLHSC